MAVHGTLNSRINIIETRAVLIIVQKDLPEEHWLSTHRYSNTLNAVVCIGDAESGLVSTILALS